MKKVFFISIMFLFLLASCSTGNDNQDTAKGEEKNTRVKATDKMKNFKLGQVVDADGIDIKVVKAEFINNYDEFSAPQNGKVLRVYFKFKNNNEDQVLVDNTDFSMKVNNENYEEWYSSDDMHEGFSHQLNHNNTASGYITYDVPDSNKYTLELNAMPLFKNVKAQWTISKAEIENAKSNNSNTNEKVNVTSDNDNSSNENSKDNEKDSDDSSDENDSITYPASMYNALVDEYNSMTDGEKMNHVSRDVLEIEYDQLEARVEELYDKEQQKAEAEYEKEQKEIEEQEARDEAKYEKEQRELEQQEAEEEAEQAREDAEFEKQQAEEEAKYQKELDSMEEEMNSDDTDSDDEAA